MRFDVITLFPEIIESYCRASIVGRAQRDKIVSVHAHNLRAYGEGRHRQVDGKPYGGGAGMVFKVGPLIGAVTAALKRAPRKKTKIILFSAKGKPLDQRMALRLAQSYERIVMICGRYEGIDERVKSIVKAEEISLGPYVLTDGEIPALAVISSVTRLLPGAITLESLEEESFHGHSTPRTEQKETLEYPHYTRPEVFAYKGKKFRVPKVLLSGNHAEVAKWREKHSIVRAKNQ
jgi:tRNA (guanine37-N1)-methyltransferase